MNDEITLLNLKVDTMSASMSDVKATLKELTSAVTKLTLIEERQHYATLALERAFKTIESIDERVNALELYVSANKKTSVWLDRATWAGSASDSGADGKGGDGFVAIFSS
jgi:hypothetical protein